MRLLLALLSAAGAIGIAACGDLSISGSSRSGGGGGSSASTVRPAEPTPKVRITQPARASFLHPGAVAIEGVATPIPGGAPIASVLLDGQPVSFDANGVFRSSRTLAPGLTVIEAVAIDADGRRGGTAIGVLAGSYAPVGPAVASAACARVNDRALDAIGKIVEGVLWSLDLSTILRDDVGVFTATNILWIRLDAQITQVRFHSLYATMDATPSGIAATLTVDGIILDANTWIDWGFGPGSPTPVTLEADRGVVQSTLSIARQPDGTVRTAFGPPAIAFTNFRATATGGLMQQIANLLPSVIENGVRDGLAKLITQTAPPELDKVLNETVLVRPPFDVFGKPYGPEVRVENIAFDDAGISLWASFQGITGPLTPRGLAAPGSFATAGALPAAATARGFMASIDDDAMNRALHMAWAGGVFDIDLDDAFAQSLGAALPFRLEVGSVRRFLPELALVAPDAAPVLLRFRPDLPAIVKIEGSPDVAKLYSGEIGLEVLVDRGAGFESFVKTINQAEIGLGFGMTSAGLEITSVATPQLRVDVVEEPLVEIDDRRLEVFLDVVLTPAIPHLLNKMPVIGIPQFNQLSSLAVDLYPDGPAREHLTMDGELVR